jgi:TPR repeat protein
VGSKLSLTEQIGHFAWADIVIAPHGAALGHSVYMQPGGALIEIGYPGKELPLIFMATALSAQLKYYLSIAEKGTHASGLTADVNDVKELAAKAVAAFYVNSADHGSKEAMFNLGNAYANGLGVPKNKVRALEWWHKAAEAGHREAAYTLGYVFLKSRPPNQEKAVEYWTKAARAGHRAAATALDQLKSPEAQRQLKQQAAQARQQQAAAAEGGLAAASVQAR